MLWNRRCRKINWILTLFTVWLFFPSFLYILKNLSKIYICNKNKIRSKIFFWKVIFMINHLLTYLYLTKPQQPYSTYYIMHKCYLHIHLLFQCLSLQIRGKSLLEIWVTTFLPGWQLPLIFVQFISNFLCMCLKNKASAYVILK